MAIVSNVNIFVNLSDASTNGTATCLYYLKETLKSAGWKVLSSSNGTTLTGYAGGTTGADSISSVSIMNNTSAWYRITDPDSSREYVFMKGSSTNAIFKYSRQTKFTGGSPNATTLPTTGTGGDGVVICGTSTDTSTTTSAQAAVFIDSAATGLIPTRYNFIADNTPTNGVYPWYFFGFTISSNITSINSCFYSHEAVAAGSCSASDNDPSWFFGMLAGGNNLFGNFDGGSQASTLTTSPGRAWYKYGLSGAAFERAIGLSYGAPFTVASKVFTVYPSEVSIPNISGDSNPYNLNNTSMPILIRSVSYPKGLSTGIKWRGGKEKSPIILKTNDNKWYICVFVSYSTWKTALLVPWPENVFPITSS